VCAVQKLVDYGQAACFPPFFRWRQRYAVDPCSHGPKARAEANGWDDLSPTTARRYEGVWRVNIRDSIGRRRIVSLGPYDVERYFRELKEAGLSQASVRYVRTVLHRACRLARKWSSNALPNPITDTELPEWSLAEMGPAVRSPSADEVRRLLSAAADDRDPRVAAFVRLLAATGMRRGEACGLRWDDVDWDRSVIRVDEAVVTYTGGVKVRGPKTRASVRAVAVDEATLGAPASPRWRR
jgi:integrase